MTLTPNQYIFFSNKEKKKQEKKTNSHWVQTPFNIQSLKKKSYHFYQLHFNWTSFMQTTVLNMLNECVLS